MDKNTVSERKQQHWSGHVASWEASGLSQQRYCDQHQLIYSTFVYWRSRLKQLKDKQPTTESVHFVPVKIKQEARSPLMLEIRSHYRIEISPGFDPALLSKVIQVVQQLP